MTIPMFGKQRQQQQQQQKFSSAFSLKKDSGFRDVDTVVFEKNGFKKVNFQPKVCIYWKSGHCTRNPCWFLHADLPPKEAICGLKRHHGQSPVAQKRFQGSHSQSLVWRNSDSNPTSKNKPTYSCFQNRIDVSKPCALPNQKPVKPNACAENQNVSLKQYACSENQNDALKQNVIPNDVIPNACAENPNDALKQSVVPNAKTSEHISCTENGVDASKQIVILNVKPVKLCSNLNSSDIHQIRKPNGSLNQENASIVLNVVNRACSDNGSSNDKMEHPYKCGDKICSDWLMGTSNQDDSCKFLHSSPYVQAFTSLAVLEGHKKAVSGIVLPSGSDKLFSGSKDKSVRMWDCHSGRCAGSLDLGGEIGCIISEGPWLFIGTPYGIMALNSQSGADLCLSGPFGKVCTLAFNDEMLFAGMEDGLILSWTFNSVENRFEQAASLRGHILAVVTLVSRAGKLYSGSLDNTIKVWNLGTSQCALTLTDHASAVTSVLCWDQYLLSCSLDQTIKVWAATEDGNLEVRYTHNVGHGLNALCGMDDEQGRSVLFCLCNDNSICLYLLPSFEEKGKIYFKEKVGAIETGPGGLFFVGSETGQVCVWKLYYAE